MYQLHAARLVNIGEILQSIRGHFLADAAPQAIVGDTNRATLLDQLSEIKRDCDGLKLTCTGELLAWIIQTSTSLRTYGEVRTTVTHVSVTFQQELARHWFGYVDAEKAKYLRHGIDEIVNNPPFGKAVLEAFPRSMSDAARAGNCFGLGQDDACIFHLMRVLEKGLAALAAELGVSFQFENWNKVIEQLESKIRKIDSSFGPDWRGKQQFYSEVACEFMFIKDAWRNHVVHGRAEYDSEKAENIYNHVGVFMKHLARSGLREVTP